jgi:PleD family two-component response regulator
VERSRLDVKGGGLSVTLSIGATLLRREDTPEGLVQRADGLMFQSKKLGRNRVTIG